MGNTWENFWKSGSVDDYLAYCRQDKPAEAWENDGRRGPQGKEPAAEPADGRIGAALPPEHWS